MKKNIGGEFEAQAYIRPLYVNFHASYMLLFRNESSKNYLHVFLIELDYFVFCKSMYEDKST